MSFIIEWEITTFSKTTLFQREPFLTMFWYYQQVSFTRYLFRFYAKNYFECLLIVSTAFKASEGTITVKLVQSYKAHKVPERFKKPKKFSFWNMKN